MSTYFENLISAVISNSVAATWDGAVREWELSDWEEDMSTSGVCTCGKEGLRYLYTIQNRLNGRTLYPIGSCCIKKFNRTDLNSEIDTQEQMFRLLHAIRDREFIPLTPEYFSRNLLLKLKNDGAFIPSQYNNYNGDNDYNFLLDMFNKRDKASITPAQTRKINGIIAFSIKPFLEGKLAAKIRQMNPNRAAGITQSRPAPIFTGIIRERGAELVRRGAITSFEFVPPVIRAEVQGQSKYLVQIALSRAGAPIAMTCTCPYAAEGNHCKHMAAAMLYAIEKYGTK